MKFATAVVAMGLLIAGCAAPQMMKLPDDHPASPKAAEAPVEPTNRTLAITDQPATTPSTKPASSTGGHNHAHH